MVAIDAGRTVLAGNPAASALFGGQIEGRDLALILRHPAALVAVGAELSEKKRVQEAELIFGAHVFRLQRIGTSPKENLDAQSPSLSSTPLPVQVMIWLNDITAEKRTNQMRADFVANVSHELRSPLASLLGFVETLQGPAKSDADAQERFLGIMQNEAERMTRLIDDLLSPSRVSCRRNFWPCFTSA